MDLHSIQVKDLQVSQVKDLQGSQVKALKIFPSLEEDLLVSGYDGCPTQLLPEGGRSVYFSDLIEKFVNPESGEGSA